MPLPHKDAELIAAAQRLAEELCHGPVPVVEVTLICHGSDGVHRTHTLRCAALPASPNLNQTEPNQTQSGQARTGADSAARTGAYRPNLSRLDQAIIDVLARAGRPLKAETVSREATGRAESNPHFRTRVRRLKELGLVVEVAGKIGLPGADGTD